MPDRPVEDSAAYRERKAYFDQFLTLYGRKTVLEALQDDDAEVVRIHLAGGGGKTVRAIRDLAARAGTEVIEATREQVTRISKNGRQDQGVVADVRTPGYRRAADFFAEAPLQFRLLGIDGMTTPGNLGMTIRSATAGGMDGICVPARRTSGIGPLVVKASAGTVFRAPLLRCERLEDALHAAQAAGAMICLLDASGQEPLFDFQPPARVVYVIGGEASGAAEPVRQCCDRTLSIPLAHRVESLNAAVTAALVAFHHPTQG